MLSITIPGGELWDEEKEEFVKVKGCTLKLEHSLVSISKWESKWNVPFINDRHSDTKTEEQTLDYIKCMTLTQNVDPNVYYFIPKTEVDKIVKYIESPMTATWFGTKDKKQSPNRQAITSELIYYWMIAFNIPFECQKWHLNRLITLIRVCEEENKPKKNKKMNKQALLNRSALNAARRKKLGTRG